jgi:hypothetical protein
VVYYLVDAEVTEDLYGVCDSHKASLTPAVSADANTEECMHHGMCLCSMVASKR